MVQESIKLLWTAFSEGTQFDEQLLKIAAEFKGQNLGDFGKATDVLSQLLGLAGQLYSNASNPDQIQARSATSKPASTRLRASPAL